MGLLGSASPAFVRQATLNSTRLKHQTVRRRAYPLVAVSWLLTLPQSASTIAMHFDSYHDEQLIIRVKFQESALRLVHFPSCSQRR